MWSELSSGWKLHIWVCCFYVFVATATIPTYFLIGATALVMSSMSILVTSLILLAVAFIPPQSSVPRVDIKAAVLVHTINFFAGFLVAYPRLVS